MFDAWFSLNNIKGVFTLMVSPLPLIKFVSGFKKKKNKHNNIKQNSLSSAAADSITAEIGTLSWQIHILKWCSVSPTTAFLSQQVVCRLGKGRCASLSMSTALMLREEERNLCFILITSEFVLSFKDACGKKPLRINSLFWCGPSRQANKLPKWRVGSVTE